MEIFTNFGIKPILLLAQIVNFLIILFLLRKFFYAPIAKALNERKKRIDESLKNADLIEEKLQKTQEQSARIIEDAQKNAQDLIADARKETQRIADQANLEARKTIEEAVAQAQIQIEGQREKMQKDLESQTLSLVVKVVRKVLGRTLSQKEKKELTVQAVSEIGRQVK